MKLTASEIQYIDNYLKKKGVSYWDIRMEMVDHIACSMEDKHGSYDFESLFKDILQKSGWHGNLKAIEKSRLQNINKTLQRKYFRNFLQLFSNLKSLIIVICFILLYYAAFKSLEPRPFRILSFFLFVLPITGFTVHFIIMIIKKKKSAYLLYGHFYILFSFLMLNLFYQLPRPEGMIEVSIQTQKSIVFFATVLNVLLIYSGVKVYLEVIQKFKKVYNYRFKN